MGPAEYLSVLRSVDDLVQMFEEHPDERVRERMTALLTGLDALHREGLERLVDRVRDLAGRELADRLADDPVVGTLLGLYDLAELDVPDEPEEPDEQQGPPVRGFVPLDQIRVGRSGATLKDKEASP